jgi:hypothetical protein
MADETSIQQTEDTGDDDATAKLIAEFQAQWERMRRAPVPSDMKGVWLEMVNTVMSFQSDALTHLYELQQYAIDSIVDLQERVEEVEQDDGGGVEGTQIEPEDAEKLKGLVAACKWLLTIILANPQPDDVKAQLSKLAALADECEKIVEESTLEEGDDDEDEGEEEETEETPPAVGQA